jgi:sec-independent protein translocase protein TatB
MFDFAWSEIALIGVVALIAIGPKDMPAAIRTVSRFVKKARRMAAEFQTHVDEMMREADLHEVRDTVRGLRSFDLRGTIERHVDEDGSLRRAFEDPMAAADPMAAVPAATVPAPPGEAPVIVAGKAVAPPFAGDVPPWVPPALERARAAREAAPSFIPPSAVGVPPPSELGVPPREGGVPL